MNNEDDVNLFNKQASGGAAPQYSRPPISPDDEGDLSFAIAADTEHGVVRIAFPKPVLWLAMEPDVALNFAGKLMEKVSEIQKLK